MFVVWYNFFSFSLQTVNRVTLSKNLVPLVRQRDRFQFPTAIFLSDINTNQIFDFPDIFFAPTEFVRLTQDLRSPTVIFHANLS